MAVSKARKRFRIFLGCTLALSLAFFATAAYVRVNIKQKNISYDDVRPTLFRIDVYQHQAKAMISNDDEKLKIGKSLFQKRIFSDIYYYAGLEMIENLAEKGHAPSQTIHADILLNGFNQNDGTKTVAVYFYNKAADQGYRPAQERLASLEKIDTIGK